MPETSELLTATEVAAMLRIHKQTVYRWADEGRISVVELPGRARRFRKAEIDALIAGTTAAAS